MLFGFVKALVLLSTCLPVGSDAITYSPLRAPSYPLAVRSPYLSAWIPGNSVASLASVNAQFWSGNNLIWTVIARVDGTTYNLFGVASPNSGTESATVTAATYTSTHSTFQVTAGSRTFTLDFFSPVSPKNYLRQSLPYSYLTVTLAAGSSSSVQIYSDIDSSWTGQTTDSTWSHSTNGSINIFQIKAVGASTYSQNNDEQALWGSAVYASRPSDSSSLTTAAGPRVSTRELFVNNGKLDGGYADWVSGSVVAFSHDLGTTAASSAVTFAIGHIREESINFLGTAQTGYYRATYSGIVDSVSHFLDDYSDANTESKSFDKLIEETGSSSYGSNYSDILALTVRQVYGAIEVTIPLESLDTGSTRAFIKEISSDGNINTVDVIYASFPIFYVLSPEYIKLLLGPVFEYQATDAYSESYAVHDLGANYPNATGHLSSGESMPIEESGNLILLAYAYQKASGNTDLATTYASQLKQYAEYLYQDGLYPSAQLSLNDALGSLANQTNLAVKAAVGIASYDKLFDETTYTATAKEWGTKIWTDHLGTDDSGSHFLTQYDTSPWFLVFNHYADKLFDLDVFPTAVYTATTEYYPTVRKTAGVPLDGSLGWGQTNWQSFVAATVTGNAREIFINDLHAYISNGLSTAPFSDRYWVTSGSGHTAGQSYDFRARPAVGSHFALAGLSSADVWSS